MSRYVPKKHQTKNDQIQWINTLVHLHDLQCDCDGPLEHTVLAINKQEKHLRFTDQEKKQLEKWLTTTEKHGTPDVDGFGDGDLEALFAEDIGEEKDTTATDTG